MRPVPLSQEKVSKIRAYVSNAERALSAKDYNKFYQEAGRAMTLAQFDPMEGMTDREFDSEYDRLKKI